MLTLLLESFVKFAAFVFFYGAVAACAVYAGVAGGIVATLIGIIVVEHELVPPTGQFALHEPAGFVAVVAFVSVSMLVTALARSMRVARLTAESRAEKLSHQAGELEMQRREAEALAGELSDSNVELEITTDEAKRSRDAALESEARLRLIDDAGRVLASSLDYETTVAAVARLAVPGFADWCGVDVLGDGEIKRLAIAHVDPGKVQWAREVVDAKFRQNVDAEYGVPAVIRTGQSWLIPVVTENELRRWSRTDEQLAVYRALGMQSLMIVPMTARSATLGALTLVSSRPTRHFDANDLAIAEELARRAATAIDNSRLYRAALTANEAKANFLATMSHELRTPLTAIIGYQELLAEGITGPVNDPQRQQLHRIKISANHLLQLIDQILLFTRVEAGREVADFEPVAVRGVVEDAVAYVLPAAHERGLNIRVDPIPEGLVLLTDAAKLRQMLTNLLSNAVKFTSEGEVTMRVIASDDEVAFEVEDTGPGISDEALEHIFEPFWQVQQTTTRESGGSGLGLTVTQRLARLVGGAVTVDSEIGKGSVFRLVLPKKPPTTSPRIR